MHQKQNGSAATGFMVGLLVGLLIAVVIAFFVAKVPINTFGTSKPPGVEGAGLDSNGLPVEALPADPNAALYSKQVPSLPPSGFTGSQTTIATINAAPKTDSDPNAGLTGGTEASSGSETDAQVGGQANDSSATKTDQKLAQENKAHSQSKPKEGASSESKATGTTPAKTKPATSSAANGGGASASSDPLADLIKSKDASKGSTQGANAAFDYYVQAGAFRNKEEAEQVRAKLQSLGVPARLSERVQGDGTVYRVRSGPFAQRTSADSARDKVASSGMDAVIVSVPR